MSRFTVCWHRQAERDLARIWNEQAEPSAVTAAANAVDALLAADPDQYGTDVTEAVLDIPTLNYLLQRIVLIPGSGPLRFLSVPPLQVFFSVRDADRQVNVWLLRKQQ